MKAQQPITGAGEAKGGWGERPRTFVLDDDLSRDENVFLIGLQTKLYEQEDTFAP